MTATLAPIENVETRRRRAAALRAVIAEIERHPHPELPWDEVTAGFFTDRSDLVQEIHGSWSRRLAAVVDTALELDDADLEAAVMGAWRRTAEQLPGVRHLLDRYADEPAVQHHQLVDHRMLAVAAGLAALHDPWEHSAVRGRRLVAQARAGRARR